MMFKTLRNLIAGAVALLYIPIGVQAAVVTNTTDQLFNAVNETSTTLRVNPFTQISIFVSGTYAAGNTVVLQRGVGSPGSGAFEDVATVTPILMSYSRSVEHLGPHGAGQLGKTCNNMMHWAACVANYEVLALAKSCGIDAQAMRETLLKCPARNTTLERWDSSRFTWHEKDMDVALDLSQQAGLSLPLFGAVDQLVKRLGPDRVRELLHEEDAEYLGLPIPVRSLRQVTGQSE